MVTPHEDSYMYTYSLCLSLMLLMLAVSTRLLLPASGWSTATRSGRSCDAHLMSCDSLMQGKADNVELPRPMPYMLSQQIE